MMRSGKMHLPTIAYRCPDPAGHQHFKAFYVDEQAAAGDMEFVGDHCRVACYAEHKIWAKTPSGPVTTMQLVEPAEVYARKKRQ
jgi:hypothetical protein